MILQDPQPPKDPSEETIDAPQDPWRPGNGIQSDDPDDDTTEGA